MEAIMGRDMFQMSLETGMTPSLFSAMGEVPFCSVKCSVNNNDTTGKGEMQDIMYFVFVATSTDRLVYGNAINRNSVGADDSVCPVENDTIVVRADRVVRPYRWVR